MWDRRKNPIHTTPTGRKEQEKQQASEQMDEPVQPSCVWGSCPCQWSWWQHPHQFPHACHIWPLQKCLLPEFFQFHTSQSVCAQPLEHSSFFLVDCSSSSSLSYLIFTLIRTVLASWALASSSPEELEPVWSQPFTSSSSKGILIYMLWPWRACTRDDRTLLLTHLMHYGTYHLPWQLAASNATSVISCCVQRRTWFQVLWCHIAWQNLASNLRNFFPSTSTHLSCRRDGRLRKARSEVTDLLLHRSQRSSCQDHNTDAASSKVDLHAR